MPFPPGRCYQRPAVVPILTLFTLYFERPVERLPGILAASAAENRLNRADEETKMATTMATNGKPEPTFYPSPKRASRAPRAVLAKRQTRQTNRKVQLLGVAFVAVLLSSLVAGCTK